MNKNYAVIGDGSAVPVPVPVPKKGTSRIVQIVNGIKRWLKEKLLLKDPESTGFFLFCLFLVAFPIIAVLYSLFVQKIIIISIPLMLMFFCGLLAYHAVKAIKNRKGE